MKTNAGPNRRGRILRRAAALALLVLAAPIVQAQERPIALTNARVLTQALDDDGNVKVIENGTILLRGGRIEDVGENLFLPPGTRMIDLKGGSVLPGLVHAWSSAGLSESGARRGRRRVTIGRGGRPSFRGGGGGRVANQAADSLQGKIYARQDVFGDFLDAGVTTLAVHPNGRGFPGHGARLDLAVEDESKLLLQDETFVTIIPGTDQASRDLLKKALEDAKKLVKKRNAPKPEPKPEESKEDEKPEDGDKPKDGDKPAEEGKEKPEGEEGGEKEKPKKEEGDAGKEKPEQEKKPQKKKQKPENPNTVVLADLLEGKRKGFLNLSTAADMLHMQLALGDMEVSFPCVLIADRPNESEGSLMRVIGDLKAMEPTVLIRPMLTSIPFTQTVLNPAKQLIDAGLQVGFVLSDSPQGAKRIWFDLMELVRYGLPPEIALAGVTRIPAEALGVDAEVGTIEAGKLANLLVFSGDPLDPTSRMEHVFHRGERVGQSDGGSR